MDTQLAGRFRRTSEHERTFRAGRLLGCSLGLSAEREGETSASLSAEPASSTAFAVGYRERKLPVTTASVQPGPFCCRSLPRVVCCALYVEWRRSQASRRTHGG